MHQQLQHIVCFTPMSITIPWRNSYSLPCVLFTLGYLELSTLFRGMVFSVFTNGVECANSLAKSGACKLPLFAAMQSLLLSSYITKIFYRDPHVDEYGAHCAPRGKRKQCILDGKANYIIWTTCQK